MTQALGGRGYVMGASHPRTPHKKVGFFHSKRGFGGAIVLPFSAMHCERALEITPPKKGFHFFHPIFFSIPGMLEAQRPEFVCNVPIDFCGGGS